MFLPESFTAMPVVPLLAFLISVIGCIFGVRILINCVFMRYRSLMIFAKTQLSSISPIQK